MNNYQFRPLKFAASSPSDFQHILNTRVSNYFKEMKVARYATSGAWVKAAIMLSMYFIPLAFIIFSSSSSVLTLLLWSLMGIGMVGIGTCITHDALHGAFSSSKRVNSLLGFLMDIVGGNSKTWKIQHNYLHHNFTNMDGLDEDIENTLLLRFSPVQDFRPVHKYQRYYAWILYSLLTLNWITAKDFFQIAGYSRRGIIKKQDRTRFFVDAIVKRVFYFAAILTVPLFFSSAPWHITLIGFLIMHLIAGFSLSCIFQPAHIVETSSLMNEKFRTSDDMKDSWALHEIKNTSNFANGSRIITWLFGALNYQIEHHLFPGVSHVHYPAISSIVKKTAEEFSIPYNEYPTYFSALRTHYQMLKKLGEPPLRYSSV